MRSLVFIQDVPECGERSKERQRLPALGGARLSSEVGDGPQRILAAVGAHRRAVAPRAARARDTVTAVCGIGAQVAGDGVTALGAYPRLDLRRDAASEPDSTNSVDVREARSNNPILHSRVACSAITSIARAGILLRCATRVKCGERVGYQNGLVALVCRHCAHRAKLLPKRDLCRVDRGRRWQRVADPDRLAERTQKMFYAVGVVAHQRSPLREHEISGPRA
jgi:hypothetical protein